MTSATLSKAVTRADDDTWTFTCPGVAAESGEALLCGVVNGPGFTSTGWPTRFVAEARGAQHFAEHKSAAKDVDGVWSVSEPMPPLKEFHAEHGLTPSADGLRAVFVSVKDL